MDAAVWFKRIKCLVLVCIFASIGNFISTSKAGTPVTPLEGSARAHASSFMHAGGLYHL